MTGRAARRGRRCRGAACRRGEAQWWRRGDGGCRTAGGWAGAAEGDLDRGRGDHGAEHGAAERAWHRSSEGVERGEYLRRAGTLQQHRPGCTAELSHHGGGVQAVADDVTDHHAEAAVAAGDDVVPVAADLKRADRGFLARGERRGKVRGPRIDRCRLSATSVCRLSSCDFSSTPEAIRASCHSAASSPAYGSDSSRTPLNSPSLPLRVMCRGYSPCSGPGRRRRCRELARRRTRRTRRHG